MTTTNEIKVYSPQDVYDSYVREVIESEEVGEVINSLFYGDFNFDKFLINSQTRVKIKLHSYDKMNDDCVVISVMSLWLDEKPIMVLLSSFDPDARCYESTYTTDEYKYNELISYLHSLCQVSTSFPLINKDEKVLSNVQSGVNIYIQQVLERE